MCLCTCMLALEWKRRAFIEKVNSRCFRWFPVSILVDQNCLPIWHLHTKLYKGAWNVLANNSDTHVGHKDLRFGQIVYKLVFIYFFVPCLLRDSENEELLERYTCITEVKGSNSVQAWMFFRLSFCNCKSCVYNCDLLSYN